MLRNLFALILIVSNTAFLFAFEGDIQLTRHSQYDTTYFVFYVKDSKVRVDEFNASGQLSKTLIVNLATEDIVALSPALKLYTKINSKQHDKQFGKKVDVIKSDNFKLIEGKKCYQWRVRDRALDREITYWVTESDLDIMLKLYHILDITENYSSIPNYYSQIPENEGFIPLIAIERNLVREQRQLMQITSIKKRRVPSKFFEIPSGYKNLRL